eukprot:8029306-Pyramimonas_sp.AAC.1
MNVDAKLVCSDNAMSGLPVGAPGGGWVFGLRRWAKCPERECLIRGSNTGAVGGWGSWSSNRPGDGNDGRNPGDPNKGRGRGQPAGPQPPESPRSGEAGGGPDPPYLARGIWNILQCRQRSGASAAVPMQRAEVSDEWRQCVRELALLY